MRADLLLAALQDMLPAAVHSAQSISSSLNIYPQEFALIHHAAERRQQEFSAGRCAAKQALAQLNVHEYPVLKGEGGEPVWPPHIQGSISHSQNIALASAAISLNGIGIDIEKQRPLKANVERVICSDKELSLDWHEDENIAKLILFAAKESVYKALYPQVRRFIGFKEVELSFDEQQGFVASFSAEGIQCQGQYRCVEGFVMAACETI